LTDVRTDFAKTFTAQNFLLMSPRRDRIFYVAGLTSILPIIFLISALQLTKSAGPQWLGSNSDPCYPYLLNSLLILKGQPPAHTDHPGTTTQLFGAACLRLSSFQTRQRLINDVLDRPEAYIKRVHRALLWVTAFILWTIAIVVSVLSGDILKGLALQIPVFFFPTIFHYTISFSSDLTEIGLAVAAAGICGLLLTENLSGSRTLLHGLLGMTCGIGMATKLTFFPVILVALICVRSWKDLAAFAITSVAVLALVLIPVYPEFPRIARWIVDLATHSGYYGTGEVGFVRADRYSIDLEILARGEPLFLVVPIGSLALAALVTLFANTTAQGTKVRSLLPWMFALTMMQAIGFLLVAKHASVHYLIPLYLTLSLNLILLIKTIGTIRQGMVQRGSLALLCGLVIAGSLWAGSRTIELNENLKRMSKDQLEIYRIARLSPLGVPRVDYYRSPTPEFALCFGNGFARRVFSKRLKERFPTALFFNIFNGKFEDFDSFIEPRAFFSTHRQVLFFGDGGILLPDVRKDLTQSEDGKLVEVQKIGQYAINAWLRK
jgi:hypothetical protein